MPAKFSFELAAEVRVAVSEHLHAARLATSQAIGTRVRALETIAESRELMARADMVMALSRRRFR
jgi:hypothetical protein